MHTISLARLHCGDCAIICNVGRYRQMHDEHAAPHSMAQSMHKHTYRQASLHHAPHTSMQISLHQIRAMHAPSRQAAPPPFAGIPASFFSTTFKIFFLFVGRFSNQKYSRFFLSQHAGEPGWRSHFFSGVFWRAGETDRTVLLDLLRHIIRCKKQKNSSVQSV